VSYWIFSSEALPNPEMLGRPGYTPDSEYIRFGGIALPNIPKNKWMELPDSFTTIRRQDWKDKHGQEVDIPVRKFKGVIDGRFAERGVVFLDHEPTDYEKQVLKKASEELNMAWRRQCIQWYEDQVREKEVTGHGRTKPTPYEDECYEVMGMEKPYSVEAMRAQRNPGQEAATKIAEAIADGQKNSAIAIGRAVADALKNDRAEKPVVAR
jgi:hypothetical protein